jgi:hypothetical protein
VSDRYLIWSHEHAGWWAHDRRGYTDTLLLAGRYSREEALDICASAIPGTADRTGALPELPVREVDIEAFVSAYHGRYPGRHRQGPWE